MLFLFRSKLLVGVARAAFHTAALIIDSGVPSGIQKFCMRKGIIFLSLFYFFLFYLLFFNCAVC
jgi:hypothetical protein